MSYFYVAGQFLYHLWSSVKENAINFHILNLFSLLFHKWFFFFENNYIAWIVKWAATHYQFFLWQKLGSNPDLFSIFEVFSQSPFGGWWLRNSLRRPRSWSFSSHTRTGWTQKVTSKEWCPVSRTDRQPQIPPLFSEGCTWHCWP